VRGSARAARRRRRARRGCEPGPVLPRGTRGSDRAGPRRWPGTGLPCVPSAPNPRSCSSEMLSSRQAGTQRSGPPDESQNLPYAVEKAREFFKPYRPSSPQIALFKEGKLVKMIQRQDIEGREPSVVARTLADAFNEYC